MAQEPLSPLMEVITDFFVWLMLTYVDHLDLYGVEISWWSDFRSKMCMNLFDIRYHTFDNWT